MKLQIVKFQNSPLPKSVKDKFAKSNTVSNFLSMGYDLPLSRSVYPENPYSMYWGQIYKLMQGISDWRARSGTFNNPWNAPSNPLYAMPELKFIDDKLEDIYDSRAMELYNEAKNSNKKPAVMWSGGIDSTSVLVSLLKNIPNNEHDMIEVICNTDSIFEHPEFFMKFIYRKLAIRSSVFFLVTNEFLDQYILLHGDPADCLFGPSISRMKMAIRQGVHHESWQKNMDLIKKPLIQILENKTNFYKISLPENYLSDEHISEFSKNCVDWFCEKLSNNIIENKHNDYLTSIADWYWWTYFNFKWEFSCQRPFLYNNSGEHISFEKQKFFSKNTFFNTDKFQQWSYTNLKSLIPTADMTKHKSLVKKYIFDYSKMTEYYKYKNKIAGQQPALKITQPDLLFDQYWQPNHDVDNFYDKMLSEYKG